MKDNAVVTEMKLFYQDVKVEKQTQNYTYEGRVFTGIQFKDNSNQNVMCYYKRHFRETNEITQEFPSQVCGNGIESRGASPWISLGGPVKGSYLIIDTTDKTIEYVLDFGLRVDDPCKAHDDT